MTKIAVGIFLIVSISALNEAVAQTCAKPCPSNQCAVQCYKGSCDAYCVRIVRPADTAVRSQPGELRLNIPNATPELAEKIRRAIEDQ
jgi:hypothetical protein